MKNYAGNYEAQMTSYEHTVEDRIAIKKLPPHDVNHKWGLSFRRGTVLFFFNSEEHMMEKKAHYEAIYGESKIMRPKKCQKS